MNRNDVYQILAARGLKPNRRLGQNFLIDGKIVRRIAETVAPINGTVLEIGPGLGSLTHTLAASVRHLILIEIDAGYVSYLTETFGSHQNIHIIHSDILRMKKLPYCDAVVSNLPYYCASEILFRTMDASPKRITVMVQKEMAERIAATPGSPSYGALTLSVAARYTVQDHFDVGKNAFYPRPDVDSTVLVLDLQERPKIETNDLDNFRMLVKTLFWGRRKTVRTCLVSSPHISIARDDATRILESVSIDPNERGEKLTLDEYRTLLQKMKEQELI
ncbi:MAG: 16S rRNA (adenine(1518)-N(6)/adenine(1519)-N(6))-dimethyltransferase RsmA [Spirochaetota bacterium]